MEVKSNLKKALKKSGFTGHQLAKLTGIKYGTVSIHCRRGVWSLRVALKYARVLGVPICKVMGVGNVSNHCNKHGK